MSLLSDCYSENAHPALIGKCVWFGKNIQRADYSGLATQVWHYADSIITAAVVSKPVKKEIGRPDFPGVVAI